MVFPIPVSKNRSVKNPRYLSKFSKNSSQFPVVSVLPNSFLPRSACRPVVVAMKSFYTNPYTSQTKPDRMESRHILPNDQKNTIKSTIEEEKNTKSSPQMTSPLPVVLPSPTYPCRLAYNQRLICKIHGLTKFHCGGIRKDRLVLSYSGPWTVDILGMGIQKSSLWLAP